MLDDWITTYVNVELTIVGVVNAELVARQNEFTICAVCYMSRSRYGANVDGAIITVYYMDCL